eukprot:TRINITY_DN14428_c1_g1_i1.p1 TRINITY_DN14428_c1_g1~~TRINITY_DN14428_c1_g1_i1.p1  ORF type:complete len:395 (+),score=20.48 TRINITY_DN14428_c1_g1_i1:103-1185(+)
MKSKKISNSKQQQQKQIMLFQQYQQQQQSNSSSNRSRISMQIRRPAQFDFRHVRSNSSPSLVQNNVQSNQTQEPLSNRSVSEAHLQLNSYRNIVDKYSQQIQQNHQSFSIQENGDSSQNSNQQSQVDYKKFRQLKRKFSIKDRDSCSFGMCDASWKRWYLRKDHLKALLKSHYCGICQNHYCKRHTRISPHGSSGRCGQDSACICVGCFNDLSPAVQRKLDTVNKLQVRKISFKSSASTNSTSNMECDCCSSNTEYITAKQNQLSYNQNNYNNNQQQNQIGQQQQQQQQQHQLFNMQQQPQQLNFNSGQDQNNLRSGSGRQARKNWDKLARKIWSIRKWYGAISKRKNKSSDDDGSAQDS